jgi:cytochrome b561
MPQTTPHRYNAVAVGLHWLMALGLLGAIGVGWYMSGLPFSVQRLKLFNWHKWVGITLLALVMLRLLWRLAKGAPPPVAAPLWQQRAASAAHALLYLLMAAVPLLGWAYSSASGFPVVWFGVLPLPDWVAPDKQLAAQLKDIHAIAAYSLLALIVLHVAAALKHQFVDRDRLLARMGLGRN